MNKVDGSQILIIIWFIWAKEGSYQREVQEVFDLKQPPNKTKLMTNYINNFFNVLIKNLEIKSSTITNHKTKVSLTTNPILALIEWSIRIAGATITFST